MQDSFILTTMWYFERARGPQVTHCPIWCGGSASYSAHSLSDRGAADEVVTAVDVLFP
jgi:hypothetical protein